MTFWVTECDTIHIFRLADYSIIFQDNVPVRPITLQIEAQPFLARSDRYPLWSLAIRHEPACIQFGGATPLSPLRSYPRDAPCHQGLVWFSGLAPVSPEATSLTDVRPDRRAQPPYRDPPPKGQASCTGRVDCGKPIPVTELPRLSPHAAHFLLNRFIATLPEPMIPNRPKPTGSHDPLHWVRSTT